MRNVRQAVRSLCADVCVRSQGRIGLWSVHNSTIMVDGATRRLGPCPRIVTRESGKSPEPGLPPVR